MVLLTAVFAAGVVQAATVGIDSLRRFSEGDRAATSAPWARLDSALAQSFEAAIQALDGGDPETAESAARQVVQGAPDFAEGWHVLGLALANLDRIQDSVAALDRAAALYEQNAEPLVVKGDLLLSTGDRAGARRAYAAAATRDPSNWRASETLAAILEEDGDIEGAVRRYEVAIAEAPADRLFPRLRLSRLYLDQGRTDLAADLLESYLNANPSDATALDALGRIRLEAGSAEASAELFRRAVEAAPEKPELRLRLAAAERQAGQLSAATATLEAANERFPGNSEMAYELGTLYGAQRDYERAIQKFEAALQTVPEDPGLMKSLSLSLYRAGRYDDAVAPAAALAQREDAQAGDHLWLATVEEARGHPEPAIRAYGAALALEPGNWLAANNLAVLLLERDPKRALELAELAVAGAGELPAVRDTLGTAHLKVGHAEQAAELFSALASDAPEDPVAAYRLGQALLALGKADPGRAEMERALRLDPNFEYAEDARRALAVR